MKKILLSLVMLFIFVASYSQVTNVSEFRVVNATTEFGVNLPVGTKVFDMNTNKYYVAKAGVISTATLTTAAASFELLNSDDQTATEVGVTPAGNLTSTDVQSALEELQTDIDGAVTNSTDDQIASEVAFTPVGNLTEIDVQAAIAELDNIVTSISYAISVATFEETSTTPSAHQLASNLILNHGFRVVLNGSILQPSQYSFNNGQNTITLLVPVVQYDQVSVTYFVAQ